MYHWRTKCCLTGYLYTLHCTTASLIILVNKIVFINYLILYFVIFVIKKQIIISGFFSLAFICLFVCSFIVCGAIWSSGLIFCGINC